MAFPELPHFSDGDDWRHEQDRVLGLLYAGRELVVLNPVNFAKFNYERGHDAGDVLLGRLGRGVAAALSLGEEATWRSGSIYVALPAGTDVARRAAELLDAARRALPEWPVGAEIERAGTDAEPVVDDRNAP